VPEGEEVVDTDPGSEEAKEPQQKYALRHVGFNVEFEPELDFDGE
jgi:hypothetical protein